MMTYPRFMFGKMCEWRVPRHSHMGLFPEIFLAVTDDDTLVCAADCLS